MSYDRTNYLRKEEKMFDNVGGKIKVVAQFVTFIGIAASIVLFFIMTSSGEAAIIALGFVVLIFGSVSSWLSSLVLYGFGELVDNSDKLLKMNKISLDNQNSNYETSCSENTEEKSKDDSKEKEVVIYPPFHQLLINAKLSEPQINEVLKLKAMKDRNIISSSVCRKQVYKIIEDLSIDKVIKILNNL